MTTGSILVVSPILIESSLSVVNQIVIASEVWQSHKKKCFFSLKISMYLLEKIFHMRLPRHYAPRNGHNTKKVLLNLFAFIFE